MSDLAEVEVCPASQPFDATAFVDELLAAGCGVSLSIPVGHDDYPARWFVHPGPDGRPTPAEVDVVARWASRAEACPDFQTRVLEEVRKLVEERRNDV